MPLFLQLTSAVILIVLFFYFIRKKPVKIKLQILTTIAILIVVSIILDRISIMIPIFGIPGFKIGFAQLPLMLIGAIFGPFYAFFTGIIYDGISLISNPTAFPFLGFTLNKVLVGLLPAIVFLNSKKYKEKTFNLIFTIALTGLFLITTIVILATNFLQLGIDVETTSRIAPAVMKTILILALGLICIITYISHKVMLKKINDEEKRLFFVKWSVALLSVECIVQLLLTPLWLNGMYGIPIFASIFLRQIKACIMLPLNMWIGTLCYNFITRLPNMNNEKDE